MSMGFSHPADASTPSAHGAARARLCGGFSGSISPILRAGTPTTMALSGTSATTRELAPTSAFSPMRTPPTMVACDQIVAPSQIVGYSASSVNG